MEHAAATFRVTQLVGWISKSSAYSQTNFVTIKLGGSTFFRNIGRFKLLQPAGYMMYQQLNIQQLYALPTLYLCVLYLSENCIEL